MMATSPFGGMGGWHYISSPVSTFDSDQIWDYYMNYYDEATSMWIHHESPDPLNCVPAPNMAMAQWSGVLNSLSFMERTSILWWWNRDNN